MLVIYLLVLFMQRDAATANAVQAGMRDVLFSEESGTMSGGLVERSVGSAEDVTEWFSSVFLDTESGLFADPLCGNGKCEGPVWMKGVGSRCAGVRALYKQRLHY